MTSSLIAVHLLIQSGVPSRATPPIALETVAFDAATGTAGNSWGGHQTRIVRTGDGVFTAYTAERPGGAREWRVAWRQADGRWPVVARGDAGREPVNLLASPDGTLHIIAWPGGRATIWSGRPAGRTLSLRSAPVPGLPRNDGPYGSAGTDRSGTLCLLSSSGGTRRGGRFDWACLLPATGQWHTRTAMLDYRFCYTYLLPEPGGGLSLISTRDVRWEVLGYDRPDGAFAYVFNAFGYWRSSDVRRDSLERLYLRTEEPTPEHPWVHLNAQQDAYLDTTGRLHVLYWARGPGTGGHWMSRHQVISAAGIVLHDGPLAVTREDRFARIVQDARGRFYILGSSGRLYPAGMDGTTLGPPRVLDLAGHTVEYSGFGIAVPRTGTPLSDTLDVVFPSDGGRRWIYFRLDLH